VLIHLDAEIQSFFPQNAHGFKQLMALQGIPYRVCEGRRTERVLIGGKSYFIKKHQGVGWKEIFKNILQCRFPILSAKNEWLALKCLTEIHIAAPDVVGYGSSGINPATQRSFVLTRELPPHRSLEEITRHWQKTPPSFSFKYALLKEVARIARVLHDHGINHRDFYICHFLLVENTQNTLYLIDLHRAEIRKEVPVRWRIKDVAGLYFSSRESGLTKRDLLRFMREYRNKPLRDILSQEESFWQKVKDRGDRLYQAHAKN
jgi:heptose I phosphotransferase